ncbi:MAG: hypothetical protein WA862_08745 [Solirubrobacterales bacterium]
MANVRSAIAVTIAAVVLLVAAAPAGARVSLVLLPQGTSVEEVAAAGMSPGLMSAGLGLVPAEQTYLDIGQGNRVFDSLYDSDLPPAAVPLDRPVTDAAVLRRAESAPAEIVPGLLAKTLARAGRSFEVRTASVPRLRSLVAGLRGNDLLIAIERPPPAKDRGLAIGLAGAGYDGNLTSDSTRLDGYVLATDVAPTILERLGMGVPSQMSGEPIRAEGEADPAAVVALGERMAVVADRRGPVIGLSLLAWVLVLGLTAGLAGAAGARVAIRVVGLAVVYVPLVLLVGAALEPGETLEMLLVMLGAPALAAATLALLGGYRALAIGSALTVLACALDMIVGSPLTALSLMGPNPGLGARFYGIGNELEAPLAVLTVAGTGAALTGFAPRLAPRAAAAVFVAVGVCAAIVFAAGRFGADVGAAIVMPVGAAAAAAAIAARRRRAALLVVAVPFAALALLALGDLLSGANAHLTRSVLDAGGLGDLGDVAERRLRLSASSLQRPLSFVFLPLVALLVALAAVRRDRLRAWLQPHPPMRAGLIGAAIATAVGALANDSGALVAEIGAAYLLVFVGFAWAESGCAGEGEAGR